MKKMRKGRNNTLYVYLALMLSLVGLWRGGNWVVAEKLAKVEVKRLESSSVASPEVDVKSFFAVFIKQPAVIKAERAQSSGEPIDALFNKPEEEAPAAQEIIRPPEPDYVAVVKQNASVDAISDNGAVINGKFYAIGDPVTGLGFIPEGKGRVEPRLQAVSGGTATLRIGRALVVLRLPSNPA